MGMVAGFSAGLPVPSISEYFMPVRLGLPFLLRLQRKNARPVMIAKPAIPPITPPTMAPVFELLSDDWGAADAVSVTAPRVFVAAIGVGLPELPVFLARVALAEDEDVAALGFLFCASPLTIKTPLPCWQHVTPGCP